MACQPGEHAHLSVSHQNAFEDRGWVSGGDQGVNRLIARELAEGLLKPLPLEQGGTRRPRFCLYSNKDKVLGPATQILIELLKNFDGAPLEAPFAAPQPPA